MNVSLPCAGFFHLSDKYNARVVIRKGDIGNNPRGGPARTFKFRPSDGFEALKGKIDVCRQSTQYANQPLTVDMIFFKRCKGAVQHNFVPLTDDSWCQHLCYRWERITAIEIGRWRLLGRGPRDEFVFEFFVYVEKVDPGVSTIHRASKGRMSAAREVVQAFEGDKDVTFGPITKFHVTRHHARMPNGTNFSVPDDNTTRQVQYLDSVGAGVIGEEKEKEAKSVSHVQPFWIKLNGTWVDCDMDVSVLCRSLGLPDFHLYGKRLFKGYRHPKIAGVDVPDTDHAGGESGDDEEEEDVLVDSKPAAKPDA